jgi:hypothetical protein
VRGQIGACASSGRYHTALYFHQKSGNPRFAPPPAFVAFDGAGELGCRYEKNQCPTKC